ncbi:MAG: tetratricopeptide repeat protein [Verrucomicrobiota bacterium]
MNKVCDPVQNVSVLGAKRGGTVKLVLQLGEDGDNGVVDSEKERIVPASLVPVRPSQKKSQAKRATQARMVKLIEAPVAEPLPAPPEAGEAVDFLSKIKRFFDGYGPCIRIPESFAKIRPAYFAAATAVAAAMACGFLLGGAGGERQTARPVPAPDAAIVEMDKAMALLYAGDPAGALALLDGVEKKHGGAPSLDYMIALAALHAGDTAAAGRHAKASIEKNERVSDSLVLQSMVEVSPPSSETLIRDPKFVREALLRRAIAHDPANPFPMVELAGVLRSQGRGEEALAALRSAKDRLHPVDTHVVVETSLLLAELQAKADSELPAAAEDGPLPEMFASVYISLRKGRADLAAKALERCRRLSSPDLFGYVMGDPAFASLRGGELPGAM